MEEAANLQCDIFTWITCGFGHFLLYFGLNYSSALLVILTVEKFIALYFFLLRLKLFVLYVLLKWLHW